MQPCAAVNSREQLSIPDVILDTLELTKNNFVWNSKILGTNQQKYKIVMQLVTLPNHLIKANYREIRFIALNNLICAAYRYFSHP